MARESLAWLTLNLHRCGLQSFNRTEFTCALLRLDAWHATSSSGAVCRPTDDLNGDAHRVTKPPNSMRL